MTNKKMTALLIAIVTFSAISAMIEDSYEDTDTYSTDSMDSTDSTPSDMDDQSEDMSDEE